MTAHKNICKIIAAAMALAVCLCLGAAAFSGSEGGKISMEYETALFDTGEIIDVNIIMDESQWAEMLDSAAQEKYFSCDVEINGSTFSRVGIRPKGNTSLTTIVNDPTTDRYSFKLEFDHYVDGQTCFGLDKLILNNNYADAAGMKEALVYDIYAFLGADASLYNYAKISVNGEYWGIYLALEAVEDSFMLRNYGVQSVKLYKPEGIGAGGGFSSGGGADLNYSGDGLDSYSAIWDSEVTASSQSDRRRVVKALKCISEGTQLEDYMDIGNLLLYMAGHIFSVNDDSLSGNMAHNYYLCESGGRLNIIPWDYNLAFGGMGMNKSASAVVNSPIDDAFNCTSFFDTLMAEEKYHSEYYAVLRRLVDDYVLGGGFDSFYSRTRSAIDALIKDDPTAFYSYDEYLKAAETLYKTILLRGESISAQLDGAIPSSEEEQRGSVSLIDASEIDLSDMGGMGIGGMGGDMGIGMGAPDFAGSGEAAPGDFTASGGFDGAQPDALAPNGTELPGESPDKATDGEFSPPGAAFGASESEGREDAQSFGHGRQDFPGIAPEGGFSDNFPGDFSEAFPGGELGNGSGSTAQALKIYAACLVLIAAALAFAVLFRRRPRR